MKVIRTVQTTKVIRGFGPPGPQGPPGAGGGGGGGPTAWEDIVGIPPAVSAIGQLSPQADRVAYYIGGTSAALTPITAFGRSLIDDADAATARGTLGAAAATHTHDIDAETTGSLSPARIAQEGAAVGQVLKWTGTVWAPGNDLTGGAGQDPIQWQDEGNSLGSPGAVNTVNFVGPGVTATYSTGTLTVDVSGTFAGLTDTPSSYAGAASHMLRVNSAETGLEFRTPAQVLGDIGAAAASHTHTVSDVSGAVPDTRQVNSGTGLTGGGDLTTNRTLALTGQALALHNLSTSGLIARTGAGTVAARSITAGANISVSNGDGVSGNPTIAVTGLAAVATSGSASDLTSGTLPLARGGTGAGTAAGARSNLGAAASGAVGSSDLTMSTARLLGRTSAGTGAIEEIAVGTGLSLSGGTLSATGGGGGQEAVQFQDEGNNLGSAGTVETVNFTGAGVTASRSGNTVTVNVPGGSGGNGWPPSRPFIYIPGVGINVNTLTGSSYGAVNGTGAVVDTISNYNLVPTDAYRNSFGWGRFRKGTTATGRAHNGIGSNVSTNSEWFLPTATRSYRVRGTVAIPDLNDATDTFFVSFTFSSEAFSYNARCVGFFYHTSSANWLFRTRFSSAETTTDTNVEVQANTLYTLEVVWTDGQAQGLIDGTVVATHTTNLPTTGCSFHFGITGITGTNQREVWFSNVLFLFEDG